MRYLLGILGIILFVGLVFGSVYFSIFDPNMNLMVAGLVIAIVILVAGWKVKKKKIDFEVIIYGRTYVRSYFC